MIPWWRVLQSRDMRWTPKAISVRIAALATAAAVCWVISANFSVAPEVWKRESPLVSPIAVLSVQDGTLTLADGRTFRPAGVGRRSTISASDYDEALRVISAQGVAVLRDRGDGTAFLLAEPRFYNWCGTCARRYAGQPGSRWMGTFYQAPLSELLVFTGYAYPEVHQPNLTERERWRLEGVRHAFGDLDVRPLDLSPELSALSYDGRLSLFQSYDNTLELSWKPAPKD
jgi:hypothetical protein